MGLIIIKSESIQLICRLIILSARRLLFEGIQPSSCRTATRTLERKLLRGCPARYSGSAAKYSKDRGKSINTYLNFSCASST